MQNRPRNYPFPFRLCPRKGSFSVASSFAATASDRAGLALSSPNKTASVTSGLFCSLGNARGLTALTFVGLKMGMRHDAAATDIRNVSTGRASYKARLPP